MGRVLPSGRVFGEAVALPQIGFAKKEPLGGRIQEVVESPLTNMAVAGISRIKDELDYQDRLQAEKSRVAGAQIAERKAEAALKALQEQQTARTAALAAAEEREARIAAEGEAMMRAEEQADRAEYQQGLALGAMQDAVDRIVGGSPRAAAQSEAALSAMGDVAGAVGAGRRGARLPQQSEFARAMAALNEDPVAFEVAMRARERAAAAPPTQEQQFLAGLAQAEDPVAYEAAWRAAQQQGGYDPSVAGRPGDWRITPPLVMDDPAPPIPEEVTAEQLAEAQAALEAAQKAAAVPMASVPRTMADFRFKIRELERALVSSETPEQRAAITDQLRSTMETARGAVDVQPKDLMEAITGAAGKRAQKKAFEGMSTGEKEFLRQMYEASKEKRAGAAEKRDESREARAQAKHDADMERADKKAKARARALARGGRGKRAALIGLGNNYLKHKKAYNAKSGMFSHEAIEARAGQSLAPEDADLMRQEIWKGLTTLPTGQSVSGETTASLMSKLRSMGMSKKDESALAPGISLTGRREDAETKAEQQDKAAKEAAKAAAAKAAEAGYPVTATAINQVAQAVAEREFLAYMRQEGKDIDNDDDVAEGSKKANDAYLGVMENHYPGITRIAPEGDTAPAKKTPSASKRFTTPRGVPVTIED